jgi:hypothetical protein
MPNLTAGKQNANGNSQIKRTATLAQVGRREIDRDTASRPGVASCTNGGAYALARLAYRGVRKANNSRCRNPRGNVDFDLNGNPFDANQCGRGD